MAVWKIAPALAAGNYIGGLQFEAWKYTQLLIDVVPGRGSGFSLEAPLGVRFLTRSRVFDENGNASLDDCPRVSAWPEDDHGIGNPQAFPVSSEALSRPCRRIRAAVSPDVPDVRIARAKFHTVTLIGTKMGNVPIL
jgi:hypothetical protein